MLKTISNFLNAYFAVGGFRMPRLRRYRTIRGVAPNVMLILTGANTLWIAYAITNVPAPAAALPASAESPHPNRSSRATTSIPLAWDPRSWTNPSEPPCAD